MIAVDEEDLHRRVYVLVCPKGIESLSPCIGRLDALEILDLHNTRRLTHLPAEIGNLRNLTELVLDGSAIASLPPSIGRLRSLEELDVSNTDRLNTIPEEVDNLPDLVILESLGVPLMIAF